MKKRILMVGIVVIALLIGIAFGAILMLPNNDSDDGDDEIRTTITKEEWDKTMQMNNFTVTDTVSIYPEHLRVMSVTKDAIKVDWSGDVSYSVNENGAFYSLCQLDGEWYRQSDANYDTLYTTFSHLFITSPEFDDLIYDSKTKTYIEHAITEYDNYYCAYSFENGVLKQFKVYFDYDEAEGYFLISNIGTTVVDVPEYTPLSTRYALEVMPNGGAFEQIDISSYDLPATIKECYKALNGGYVFQVEFAGFSLGNTAYIGIDDNGKITGTKIHTNNESTGFGQDILPKLDNYGYFNGATIDTIDQVDTVSGCTVSTKAYRDAVKDALYAAAIINGEDINLGNPDAELSLNDILNSVLGTQGLMFEQMDISSYDLSPEITEAYKSYRSNYEYVFKIEFNGYNADNIAYIGIGADGKVTGTKMIVNNDTPAFGGETIPELDNKGHFNGATIDTIDGVDTVAGVTVSTKAYREAIKSALQAAAMFGGAEVDTRTPEEILHDNLNAALGTEDVDFTKHFFMEVVEGVDAIYVAENGAGHVVVIGEQFFGFDANGNAVGETNAVATTAIATIKATTYTVIENPQAFGASKRVKSALVTNGGVYVLEVEGAGFGKNGDSHYHPSGEYIVIKIAITADGKIIDCYTVYQSETEGLGDVCGTEEFYCQFAGKTQDNYEDVIIAGSTYTTDGYHGAIKNAFRAVAKFEEEK